VNTEISFLNQFVLQSHEGNLKTSQYSKEFADLKMKHPPDGKGTRTAAAASEAAAAVGGGDQCER
jgi:hypothetical protein